MTRQAQRRFLLHNQCSARRDSFRVALVKISDGCDAYAQSDPLFFHTSHSEGRAIRGTAVPGGTPTRTSTARRIIAAVVAGLSGWVAFAVYSQAERGNDVDAAARQLAAQNAVLQQQIADARTQISEAQDPAWLQEQARRIGYVLPGEKVYVLVTPGTTPLPLGGGVSVPPPTFSPSPSPTAADGAPPAPPAATTPTPTPYVFVIQQPSH